MRAPLGQHFLRDLNVVKIIVTAAAIKTTDTVLEIGPGKGALTGELLGRGGNLTAVELDRTLAQELEKRYQGCDRFRVVQEDFLKSDLDKLFSPETRPITVLGNLPYSITSPILEKVLAWNGWETAVFLIQREVAERIASAAGSRTYGILTLAVQLFAHVETILQVKPEAFHPPPQVTSSVIRLQRKTRPGIAPEKIPDFFDVVHGAFAHRRKTIANSLAFFSGISRSALEKWLRARNVPPSARAETLTLEDYAQLADAWSIFRREMNLTSETATSTIPNT